jgi:Winged helix DNA-binding domain
VKVSWDQVHAWRLRRQFVDPAGGRRCGRGLDRLCGVQAQVASSAELAVRLRQADPEAGAIERGVADGALVKTWAMRASLHLLRSSQAPSFLSLIASTRAWEKPSWQRAFGAPRSTSSRPCGAVSRSEPGSR